MHIIWKYIHDGLKILIWNYKYWYFFLYNWSNVYFFDLIQILETSYSEIENIGNQDGDRSIHERIRRQLLRWAHFLRRRPPIGPNPNNTHAQVDRQQPVANLSQTQHTRSGDEELVGLRFTASGETKRSTFLKPACYYFRLAPCKALAPQQCSDSYRLVSATPIGWIPSTWWSSSPSHIFFLEGPGLVFLSAFLSLKLRWRKRFMSIASCCCQPHIHALEHVLFCFQKHINL
jgi:hypothetical protein